MKTDQIKRVREAAKASGLRILEHYLSGGKVKGKEYIVLNPHRTDEHAGSLSIEIASGKGGDFAIGETFGDFVGLVAFARQCKPGEAAEELARFLGIATDDAAAVPPAPTPARPAPKWRPVIPVPLSAPPPPAAHKTLGTPDHTYTYRDGDGGLLGFVLRWNARGTGKKEFRPLTWCQDAEGHGAWQWIAWETPRPLYGANLIAQHPEAEIVKCEGEKAADAAGALFPASVATCWPNGAASADKADFRACKGRCVLLWPDHDEPGTKAMQAAAKALRKAGAAVVKIINLTLFEANTVNAQGQIVPRLAPLPAGWDAADALAEGWTPEAIAELLARDDALLNAGAFVSAGTRATNADACTDPAPAAGPYVLDPELGLFHIETDREGKVRQSRVCGPIAVIAIARDIEGGAYSPVLEYRDRDGQQRREVIAYRLFLGDGHDGVKQLADLGLEIASGRQALDRLKSYIVGAAIERRARLVDTLGWHGDAFMLPEGAIGETDETLLLRGNRRALAMFAPRGSLADWQSYIAHPATGNPRLMFTLSAAFAGPLLKPLGMQGSAFHWAGDSSTGKTSAQHAAASVWGSPTEQVHSWRSTANALEYTCALHNDMTMVNDELRELDAKDAGAVAYMQSNGKGKGRAHHAGGLREAVSWRIVMLSSGELGLADHIASAGQKHYSGQEVRFLEIEAEAGAGLGMWNDVGACIGGAKQFTDNLRKFALRYHGTAGRAFVRKLIKSLGMLPTWWRSHEAAFAEQYRPADAGGQVLRVMTSFCLVGFAGELAARFEVVPWQRGAALSAAGRLFAEWLRARPSAGNGEEEKIIAHVRGIMERTWQSKFIDWHRASGTHRVNDQARANDQARGDFDPDLSRMAAVHDALGFRKPDIPFDTEHPHYFFYVTRARFAEELATKGGFKPKRVAAVLKNHGVLRCEDDNTTCRETLPNGDARSYCIIGQKLWALGADGP